MIQNGVLNVDKPAGLTSHDVVVRARRLLNIKKIGHAGTLDPDATGVLVLCIGKATRLVEYLMGMDKEYQAVMRLGVSTSTQDASGEILEEKRWDSVSEEDLKRCFMEFTGEITQIPPAFSAIKIDGVPSYKRARNGEEVRIPGRVVTIHHIDYLRKEGRDILMKIHCSKGTYIRTLCHDIGRSLGTGAHLYSLRRLRSGPFEIAESITLEEISECVATKRIDMELYTMDDVMKSFPSISLDEWSEKKILHGSPLHLKEGEGEFLKNGNLVCLKSKSGTLVALGIFENEKTKKIKIDKVLVQ